MPDETDSSGPAVKIFLDAATGKAIQIEAPSAAAATEVFRGMTDTNGPFEDDAIREFIENIDNEQIKLILKRDLAEINICSKNKAHKSILLLCGGVVEAILYQLLSNRRDDARRYFDDLNRNNSPDRVGLEIEEWFLTDMLKVSEHLGIIDRHFTGKAREITNYRNIIHPSNEIRNQITQIDHLAPISIELVKMLILAVKPTMETTQPA